MLWKNKKKPTAYGDMSNSELIREIERAIVLARVEDLMFRAVLGFKKFFGFSR